jgi:hypothetical protein
LLSVVIEPVIYVIVALSIIGVLSLCYLFKDQLEEIKTHIRKTNILHKKLKKYCKNHDYILLTNLILPTSDGKKIKVDDLVIADKYIYVISQRILYGNISGIEEDAKWILRSTKESKYISNPFIANEIRKKVIAEIANIDSSTLINLVCFSKTAFTHDVKIKSNDKRHKGLKTDFYVENGVYKYTYGNSEDYDEILKLKRSIADKFKDAFIIAFLNGKKINTREAIEMFKKQKK